MTSKVTRPGPSILFAAAVLGACATSASGERARAASPSGDSEATRTHYRTARVDGVEVFYREAGPRAAPMVVLLHGFPSSSHMFRNLIPALADRYRVIAPDYPGFGQSAVPNRSQFSYSFAHYAEIVDGLLA